MKGLAARAEMRRGRGSQEKVATSRQQNAAKTSMIWIWKQLGIYGISIIDSQLEQLQSWFSMLRQMQQDHRLSEIQPFCLSTLAYEKTWISGEACTFSLL